MSQEQEPWLDRFAREMRAEAARTNPRVTGESPPFRHRTPICDDCGAAYTPHTDECRFRGKDGPACQPPEQDFDRSEKTDRMPAPGDIWTGFGRWPR